MAAGAAGPLPSTPTSQNSAARSQAAAVANQPAIARQPARQAARQALTEAVGHRSAQPHRQQHRLQVARQLVGAPQVDQARAGADVGGAGGDGQRDARHQQPKVEAVLHSGHLERGTQAGRLAGRQRTSRTSFSLIGGCTHAQAGRQAGRQARPFRRHGGGSLPPHAPPPPHHPLCHHFTPTHYTHACAASPPPSPPAGPGRQTQTSRTGRRQTRRSGGA